VHWTHAEKLGRMEAVAELFIAESVETEGDLHFWLCGDPAAGDGGDAACSANVAKLVAVHGIGPKTIDYFKILCGEQDTAAIDMHLTRFLEQAGVCVTGYEQAREVIGEAAIELGVPTAQLDHSIWTYMSKAGRAW
jgi:endonuclease III